MRKTATILGMGALLLAGTLASADEVVGKRFGGDVMAPDGRTVRLTLSVSTLTSDDRTLELAELLLDKGLGSVAAAIAQHSAGELSFGERTGVVANVVRTLKTEAGLVVSVVTHQPLEASAAQAQASGGVGHIQLTLDPEGNGKGLLIPSADIVFGEDGFLEAKSTDGRELPIENVSALTD